MNLADIDRELEVQEGLIRDQAQTRHDLIALVFRCDVRTAHNIVNRVGQKLGGVSTDAIVVLKTADPLTIASCILEELRNGIQNKPQLLSTQPVNQQSTT